jgi:hypothetical protein
MKLVLGCIVQECCSCQLGLAAVVEELVEIGHMGFAVMSRQLVAAPGAVGRLSKGSRWMQCRRDCMTVEVTRLAIAVAVAVV